MECPKCKGRKMVTELNIAKATREQKPCPECGGTGLDATKQTDGIRVGRPCCDVLLYQYIEGGKPIATLEMWAFPMLVGEKPIMVRTDGVDVPAVVGEIHQMNTVEAHRRRGLMKKLIRVVVSDPSYKFIRTSAYDSSKAGIALLLSMGFRLQGEFLIWQRTNGRM